MQRKTAIFEEPNLPRRRWTKKKTSPTFFFPFLFWRRKSTSSSIRETNKSDATQSDRFEEEPLYVVDGPKNRNCRLHCRLLLWCSWKRTLNEVRKSSSWTRILERVLRLPFVVLRSLARQPLRTARQLGAIALGTFSFLIFHWIALKMRRFSLMTPTRRQLHVQQNVPDASDRRWMSRLNDAYLLSSLVTRRHHIGYKESLWNDIGRGARHDVPAAYISHFSLRRRCFSLSMMSADRLCRPWFIDGRFPPKIQKKNGRSIRDRVSVRVLEYTTKKNLYQCRFFFIVTIFFLVSISRRVSGHGRECVRVAL